MNILLFLSMFAGDITPHFEELMEDNQEAIENSRVTIKNLEDEGDENRQIAAEQDLLDEYSTHMKDSEQFDANDLVIQE